MEQYIPKSAVVAEIESLLNSEIGFKTQGANFGYKVCLKDIMRFIDTLEVKEVNLEKEMENWIENNQDTAGFYDNVEFAKHFFELGMQVSNKEQK